MQTKKYNVYSYSAAENEEIKHIREKYEFRNEENSKLEQLRRLDRSVHKTASVIALSVGIIGLLIMGFGMSCVLVWAESLFAAGVVTGIIGIFFIIAACPVYNIVERKKRKRIAPEIIRLTDELMK